MFGIGWTEVIIIALVLLIFVGPKNLPPLFHKAGTLMREFKSASRELRNQLDIEVRDLDSPRELVRDIGKDLFKEVSDPYEEIKAEERKLKQELLEAERAGEGVKYAPDDPTSKPDKEDLG